MNQFTMMVTMDDGTVLSLVFWAESDSDAQAILSEFAYHVGNVEYTLYRHEERLVQ